MAINKGKQLYDHYIMIHSEKYTFGFLPSLWTSPVAQLVKNPPAMQETWVRFLGWEDPLEKGKAPPIQYSGLENSMDCIVHGVAKSQTRLSDFHFHFTMVQSSENPWNFQSHKSEQGVFYCVNEVTSERMGDGCQEKQPLIRGLELSISAPSVR